MSQNLIQNLFPHHTAPQTVSTCLCLLPVEASHHHSHHSNLYHRPVGWGFESFHQLELAWHLCRSLACINQTHMSFDKQTYMSFIYHSSKKQSFYYHSGDFWRRRICSKKRTLQTIDVTLLPDSCAFSFPV